MARKLSSDIHTLILDDQVSGGEIHLYYRMPTPSELAGFTNDSVRRTRGKGVEFRTGQVRQQYGLAVLVGFRDGDFEDDTGAPISSDAKSQHFREDWRDLVAQHASDLVAVLGAYVFEGTASVREDAEGN